MSEPLKFPRQDEPFEDLVWGALRAARSKHQAMRVRHEAYAVILEELEEVKAVVFGDGSDDDMLKELVQTAAMCQRAAEDLGLTLPAMRPVPPVAASEAKLLTVDVSSDAVTAQEMTRAALRAAERAGGKP